MSRKKTFAEKVIAAVVRIPKGRTLSYKEVARRAGNERAARAVGNILNKLYKECQRSDKKTIQCHRVIRSDGGPGGYAGGKEEKMKLLKKEKAFA